MKLLNQASEMVDVQALTPHPKNPNRTDMNAITESIHESGFYGGIVAQRSTGFILAGNHRYQAAVQLGATQIPVHWVDVDSKQALKIMLADNATAAAAVRDDEALAALLSELQLTDTLTGTGYADADLDALLSSMTPATADEWDDSLGKLSSEDRQPFQQITFTLHDDQAEQIKQAMKAAQQQGPFSGPNENSNGNAIARICERFMEEYG